MDKCVNKKCPFHKIVNHNHYCTIMKVTHLDMCKDYNPELTPDPFYYKILVQKDVHFSVNYFWEGERQEYMSLPFLAQSTEEGRDSIANALGIKCSFVEKDINLES